jgi:hypothetical protein
MLVAIAMLGGGVWTAAVMAFSFRGGRLVERREQELRQLSSGRAPVDTDAKPTLVDPHDDLRAKATLRCAVDECNGRRSPLCGAGSCPEHCLQYCAISLRGLGKH